MEGQDAKADFGQDLAKKHWASSPTSKQKIFILLSSIINSPVVAIPKATQSDIANKSAESQALWNLFSGLASSKGAMNFVRRWAASSGGQRQPGLGLLRALVRGHRLTDFWCRPTSCPWIGRLRGAVDQLDPRYLQTATKRPADDHAISLACRPSRSDFYCLKTTKSSPIPGSARALMQGERFLRAINQILQPNHKPMGGLNITTTDEAAFELHWKGAARGSPGTLAGENSQVLSATMYRHHWRRVRLIPHHVRPYFTLPKNESSYVFMKTIHINSTDTANVQWLEIMFEYNKIKFLI